MFISHQIYTTMLNRKAVRLSHGRLEATYL